MLKNQNGGLTIILLFIIIVLLVGGGAYYFGTQKNNSTRVNQYPEQTATSPIISSGQKIDDSRSKSFTSKSKGITLNYPSTWIASDDQFISEKPFVPGEQDRSKVYNIIEIRKYPDQIYQGSTNRQSFDEISNLKAGETRTDQRDLTTKITSGTVLSGEDYTIFKTKPSSTFEGEPTDQVHAYIIKDQTIYQLILNQYDENGLDTFQKIVPTVTIN